MAATEYGTNHALTNKIWARKLFHETLKETVYGKFMGEGTDSLIQVKTELKKQAGDRIRHGLRMQLNGDGIQGDDTLEGNEEALSTYADDITINQLRHATRSKGKMSEQRVLFDVREENKDGLKDWWKARLDVSFINQVTGNTAVTDTRYTGNQPTIAPSTAQLLTAGPNSDTTEASLSATTTFGLNFREIDRAVVLARTQTVPIRPINIDGAEKFVLIIHPFQTYQLRRDTTTGNWFDLHKAAIQGGKYKDNPIFTGALAEYNGTLIYEDSRVPVITGTPNSGTAANYRRAAFCGAQAALWAWGGDSGETVMDWREELFDYGNQLGVKVGAIFGVKKTVFNSIDFATIAISSYAPSV